MGISNENTLIEPTMAIMKKDGIFFSFIMYLNIFVNFTPFSIAGPVIYYLYVAIITYIPKIHQIALAIGM